MSSKSKDLLRKAVSIASKLQNKVADQTAVVFSTLSEKPLLKWTESITQSKATDYDRAMDSGYIEGATRGIGGGDHRLFDGGHDLLSAWDKVKDAKGDDSFAQEVIGYVQGLIKDVTTAKGLPFDTLDKKAFDSSVAWFKENVPFIDRNYLSDLASFDALEIISSSLGAVSILFCLKNEDKKRLADILGAMGVTSIASANPLLSIVVVAATGYAYFVKKHELDKTALMKGGAMAAMSAGLFAFIGAPFLIEVVLVMVISNVFRHKVIDNEQLLAEVKRQILQAYQRSPEALAKLKSLFEGQKKAA